MLSFQMLHSFTRQFLFQLLRKLLIVLCTSLFVWPVTSLGFAVNQETPPMRQCVKYHYFEPFRAWRAGAHSVPKGIPINNLGWEVRQASSSFFSRKRLATSHSLLLKDLGYKVWNLLVACTSAMLALLPGSGKGTDYIN